MRFPPSDWRFVLRRDAAAWQTLSLDYRRPAAVFPPPVSLRGLLSRFPLRGFASLREIRRLCLLNFSVMRPSSTAQRMGRTTASG